MKKILRTLLCTGLLAGLLSIPSLAAPTDVMPISAPVQKQGDFYVLLNGEYATFTDAVPKIKDGRSCLPFVAVFEQLGFAQEDMTWDAATSTIIAMKDGKGVKLTIGQPSITTGYTSTVASDGTVIESGKTIDTDVAPYVDPESNRTYVPFGLVADALGYKVGWDANQGAVIIDDVDAILAANKETYTLMDKFMAYNKGYTQGNHQVTGSYDMGLMMDIGSAEENMSAKFTVDGKYEMLTAGYSEMQFKTNMNLDMAMTENGAAVIDPTMPKMPMAIDMDMRGSLNDGIFYFQSAALSQMMEQPGMTNAWFKMDLAALMDQMSAVTGMDYAMLMKLTTASMDGSFADTLSTIVRSLPLTSVEYTTADYLALINAFMADSAFTKTGNDYVNKMESAGVVVTFTVNTNGTQVNGYSMNVASPKTDMANLSLNMGMKNDKMTMDMNIDVNMGITEDSYIKMNMTMTMDGTYKTTTTKPVSAPPADATIIDMMNMMGA